MKKITMLAAAAVALSATVPAIAQEQMQLTPEMMAMLQQQMAAKFDFAKLEGMLPEVIGTISGKDYTKAEFIAQLKEDPQAGMYLGSLKEEEYPQALRDMAQQIMTGDMLKTLVTIPDAAATKIILLEKFNELPEQNRKIAEDDLAKMNKTVDDYCAEIAENPETREAIAINEYFDKILAENKIGNEAAAKKFYEESKDQFKISEDSLAASHILIPLNEDATPEEQMVALEKANAVLTKINGGADFAAVAIEESSCPSKEQGGSLGVFAAGDMVPEFSEAVIMAEPGKVIDHPVKTQFGYHIIRRDATQEMVPFEEVAPQIERHLKNQFISEYVTELTKKNIVVNIEVPPATPKAPAAPTETPVTPVAK